MPVHKKVWQLHAALFGVYHFCYIEQTAVGQTVLGTLTNIDDAVDVIYVDQGSSFLMLTWCGN